MTFNQHRVFLDRLENALDDAITRYRALHHASIEELYEMKEEVTRARAALENASGGVKGDAMVRVAAAMIARSA